MVTMDPPDNSSTAYAISVRPLKVVVRIPARAARTPLPCRRFVGIHRLKQA